MDAAGDDYGGDGYDIGRGGCGDYGDDADDNGDAMLVVVIQPNVERTQGYFRENKNAKAKLW